MNIGSALSKWCLSAYYIIVMSLCCFCLIFLSGWCNKSDYMELQNEIKEMKNEIKEMKTTVKELIEMMKAVYEFEDE